MVLNLRALLMIPKFMPKSTREQPYITKVIPQSGGANIIILVEYLKAKITKNGSKASARLLECVDQSANNSDFDRLKILDTYL